MIPALYLIPTNLGEAPYARLFPPYNTEVILSLRHKLDRVDMVESLKSID